jgi:FG-GAP-like repeat
MNRFPLVFALLLAAAAANFTAFATDVLTNRGDLARTGLNPNETILNPSNVASPAFGLLFQDQVDGQVYAQPLYVFRHQITPTGGQPKVANVLYVATEHDSLYAFDADTGALYWQTSLLPTGESPVSSNDVSCVDLQPEIGITATPVIDRSAGPNGTIFVVAFSKNATDFFDRLHAIDLSTGQDRLTPVNITASSSGNGPANTFNPLTERSRPGLLLLNARIYTAWGSFCDNEHYTGWIIAYNESDLSRALVLNTNPNGTPPSSDLTDGSGNGIWQAGNGPAVDSNGNIYVTTSNGPFDPTQNDFGDSVLKLPNNTLTVADYFTPFDQFAAAVNNTDFGSGGPMVLPDLFDANHNVHHLLVAAGKDENLYLLNRDNLGQFNSSNNNQIYQELSGALTGGVWSSPAYFNTFIYFGGGREDGAPAPLWQFQFDFTSNPNKPLLKQAAIHQTSIQFNAPGPTPTVSSNGNTNGIVWVCENNSSGQAVLHAYDATNVETELFNSGNIGVAAKFAVPTVCNGKVYVGTANSVAAFGGPEPAVPQGSHVAKDFNNDGFADLIWEQSVTGQRAIWFMKNGVLQSTANLPTVSANWHIAGVGDFLGNGQSDLVWENTSTGERAIWFMENGSFQSALNLPTVSTQWEIVGAGDFDGDGQADLVWENTTTGQRAIWFMVNGVLQSTANLPTMPTQWHIAGVGDFLGNGQSDLVWENTSTGQRAIWLMKNGILQSSFYLPTVSTQWHIGGAVDLFHQGQSDLVWENTASGQRAVWVLHNGALQRSFYLPTVSTDWHIVDH